MDLVISNVKLPHDCSTCFARNGNFCQIAKIDCMHAMHTHTMPEQCPLCVDVNGNLCVKDYNIPHDCSVCFARYEDICQITKKGCSKECYIHCRMSDCELSVVE